MNDPEVESLIVKLRGRVREERAGFSRVQWLQHLQRRCLEMALDIERLIQEETNAKPS